jgi:hypothetical protein
MADTYDPETTSTETAAPAPADDGKQPIEAWAEAKGMLPKMQQQGGWPRLNPHYLKFAAAKGLMGWPDGQLVTEQEFDAAVARQAKEVTR